MRYDYPPEVNRLWKLGRIAIWNRSKIIFGIVMAIWVTDITFLVKGWYFLQIVGESLDLLGNIVGVVRVNFQFDCFGPVRLT
jgi:hypothetical protein